MTAISDTDVLTNCMQHLLHHRELFYLQLRADMKCGDLSVPESRVGLVGALDPDAGGRGPQGQPSLTEIEAAFER